MTCPNYLDMSNNDNLMIGEKLYHCTVYISQVFCCMRKCTKFLLFECTM